MSTTVFPLPGEMPLINTRQAVRRLYAGGGPEEETNAIVNLFVNADEQIGTQ